MSALSSDTRVPKTESYEELKNPTQINSMTKINGIEAENLEDDRHEIQRCLWPFICFYRLCGMSPIAKRGNDLVFPKYNFYWIFTVFALIVQAIKLNSTIRSTLLKNPGPVIILKDLTNFVQILGNYIYMIWVIKRIPNFITSCKRIGHITINYCAEDGGLPRNCKILLVSYMIGVIIRNGLIYYAFALRNNLTSIGEFEKAFNNAYGVVGGGHFSAFTILIGNLCIEHSWMFVDLLICLLALIFKQYFVRINNVIAQAGNSSSENFEELRSIHYKLCKLVEECNELFSLLFLWNYTANVSLLFMRLYIGIDYVGNHEAGLSKFFNFYTLAIQIFLKLVLPTFLAASLNQKANEALKFVHQWPSELGNEDNCKQRLGIINRFILQLSTNQVGISGCGYFIVSKSFVVTLLSAFITYEVMILQFQGSNMNKVVN